MSNCVLCLLQFSISQAESVLHLGMEQKEKQSMEILLFCNAN